MRNILFALVAAFAVMTSFSTDASAQRRCGDYIHNGTMYISSSPGSHCGRQHGWQRNQHGKRHWGQNRHQTRPYYVSQPRARTVRHSAPRVVVVRQGSHSHGVVRGAVSHQSSRAVSRPLPPLQPQVPGPHIRSNPGATPVSTAADVRYTGPMGGCARSDGSRGRPGLTPSGEPACYRF